MPIKKLVVESPTRLLSLRCFAIVSKIAQAIYIHEVLRIKQSSQNVRNLTSLLAQIQNTPLNNGYLTALNNFSNEKKSKLSPEDNSRSTQKIRRVKMGRKYDTDNSKAHREQIEEG